MIPASPPFRPTVFRPAAWLPGPHAQTLAGRYLRRPTGVRYRRERLETPDDDFLDLDWASVQGQPAPPGAPLVLVVHGLEGSARSSYVRETCRALAVRGVRAVAMNFRGCSGEPNRAVRFYHAGDSPELAWVLERLRAREPRTALGAVGFSLGGNMLLKYLGEQGTGTPLAAAAAVSVPYDLMAGARHLDASPMGRVYAGVFVRQLRDRYRAKAERIGDRCDAARALRARSFEEFDDAVTAPLHGFRDVADYYARSSAAGFLHAVRVPTYLIQSRDDPFVPPDALPLPVVAANPALVASVTERGGHVGFVAGPPWAPRFWAEDEAARFLAERLLAGGPR